MRNRFQFDIYCDESKIQKTIEISKKAFLAGESEQTVSRAEFLYQQSRYIKKHWWLIQACLLFAVCVLLHFSDGDLYVRRSLGVAAPLFVILILPELWKNRGNEAMEVEGTTFYTIRQVYAARLTLFAGVDLLLLTAFFCGATYFARITLWELMIQFLLPFSVACCICFRSLYGGRNNSEALCILLCSVWCGLWVLVISSEPLYNAISVPVWATMLVLSFGNLAYTLCRGQQTIYKTWEAKASWN